MANFYPRLRAPFLLSLLAALLVSTLGCEPEWSDQTDFPVAFASADGEDVIMLDDSSDSGQLVLESGFQGGQHFNLLILAEGVPLNTEIRATVFMDDENGDEIDVLRNDVYFDDYYEPIDGKDRAYFRFPVGSPDSVLSSQYRFRVQLLPPSGEVGRATSITAPVRWSTMDQERIEEQEQWEEEQEQAG